MTLEADRVDAAAQMLMYEASPEDGCPYAARHSEGYDRLSLLGRGQPGAYRGDFDGQRPAQDGEPSPEIALEADPIVVARMEIVDRDLEPGYGVASAFRRLGLECGIEIRISSEFSAKA